MKKIILLVIVLSLVLTMTVNALTFTFTDISDHWAKVYIEKVAKNDLIKGYEDKTFKPDNNVNVLEALIMMSRLYEIDDELREQIIEKYESKFDSMLNTKYYEWSFEYLSVIIELGVVSEKDIESMFAKKTIFKDATREEIAVLLTEAMLLEVKNAFVLKFNDYSKIDDRAKPYVNILNEKKIFLGDEKNNFNPTNNITRAEIATVIDKAYDYLQDEDVYPDFGDFVKTTVESGIISQILTTKNEDYIYIKNESGKENIIKINDDTKITINNRVREFDDLEKDMVVNSKIDENRVAVSIEVDNSKEVISGKISLVAYAAPASLTIIDEDRDKLQYRIPSDAKVYLDGKEVELRKLKKNDEVTLLLEDDTVYQVNAISRIKHFDGVISKIDYSKYPITISIKMENDEVKTFEFNSYVDVTRNDEESSFDQVRVGDEATITTEYDDMIAINTIAKEAEMSGTIKEITFDTVSKMKIADEDGEITQYTISNNVIVTIGNKTATIYDLRLDYNVNVNTSGDEIVTIEASELQTVRNFTGKVIFLNIDDKIIMMQNKKDNGQTELIYLRVTNNTIIFNASGETKYLKDITEGENILSTAVSQNGEFIAVSVMIQ